MSDAERPVSAPSLRTLLRDGVGSTPVDTLPERYGLRADQNDTQLARELLRRLVEEDVAMMGRATPAYADASETSEPSRVVALRSSYVAGMPASGRSDALSVDGLEDVRTLLAVMRAGSILQRRAAVRRIGELLASDTNLPSTLHTQALDALRELRAPELAYDVAHVRAALSGAEGRSARAERKAWHELSVRVATRVVAFWEGLEHEEPIGALGGEERAQLFSMTRDLPDLVIAHVAAFIEESAGRPDRNATRMFVRAVEHASDPRLLPALRSVIESHDDEVLAQAARSLASTDDPRVHGLLKDAYERAVRAEERLILAAALGASGDARGLAYVREVIASDDTTLLPTALEALAELGSTDDVQRVCELLERSDERIVRSAAITLGRIADSRALVPLSQLRERTRRSALRAEVEDALHAVHARMELLGEEPAAAQAAAITWDTTKMAALAREKDPAKVRLRAFVSLLLAYFWRAMGAHARAIARFEAVAALRSGAVEPVLSVAILRSKLGETAQALAAFRRAVQIDRGYVETHGWAITAMAQAFLRRAEAMEREGRKEISRGLTEEILGFDLRRASERVRLALHERSDGEPRRATEVS